MNDERPPPKKRSKVAKILKSSTDSEQHRLTPRDKLVKEVRSYTDRPCIDVEALRAITTLACLIWL